MRKLTILLVAAVALTYLSIPSTAMAQRFRRPPPAPIFGPEDPATEKRNAWVRTILSSAWTGVFAGAMLFGLVTMGFCCYRVYINNQRIKQPWEIPPPPKPED